MPLNTDIAFTLGKGMILKGNDVTIAEQFECLVQEIKIESITAQGDLWYDHEYGWGLQDFIHGVIDDMRKLEISHRVKTKMSRREEVVKESIKVYVEEKVDAICIHVQFTAYETDYELEIVMDRVKAEVNIVG